MIDSHLSFNKTARALIMDGNNVLLCRETCNEKYFLPGWVVKHGERSETALQNNIQNTFSSKINKTKYIGAVSFEYRIDRIQLHHSYDLVYAVELGEKPRKNSHENLEFFWQDISSLECENLFPKVLKSKLVEWFEKREVFWAIV